MLTKGLSFNTYKFSYPTIFNIFQSWRDFHTSILKYPFKLFLCGTLCGCSNFQLVCSALFYTNFMLLLVYMFNRNNDDIYTLFFYLIFIPRLHFRKKTIMYKIMSDTRSATNVNILRFWFGWFMVLNATFNTNISYIMVSFLRKMFNFP
jgi:hypothetical protein